MGNSRRRTRDLHKVRQRENTGKQQGQNQVQKKSSESNLPKQSAIDEPSNPGT